MSKIEEISFLRRMEGRTGKYSEDSIVVNCDIFKITEKKNMLSSRIMINPRGMSDEEGTVKILKKLLEKGKAIRKIEDIIVATVEETVKNEIIKLQGELRELLGIPEKIKEEAKGEQDFNIVEGGDTI